MCINVIRIYDADTTLISCHMNSATHVDGRVLIMISLVLILIFLLLNILKDERIDGTL